MGTEVEKAKHIAATLEGAVKTLTSSVTSDPIQRQVFHEKLDHFLSDKSASFDQVADRICRAENELSDVKAELKASTERFNKLLDLQEKQLIRLQGLDRRVDLSINPKANAPTSKGEEQTKIEGLLSKFSLMAIPLWPSTGAAQAHKNESAQPIKSP